MATYLYHCTNRENAYDIAKDGLLAFGPSYGTDQDMWPDEGVEDRIYFTANERMAYSFAPENGQPVLLRVLANLPNITLFKEKHTGDIYTKQRIAPEHIEFLDMDQTWKPLASLIAESMIRFRNILKFLLK